MDAGRDNVIELPDRGRGTAEHPGGPESSHAAVGQLDELNRQLAQFSPHATWPARRWMIASTAFRMRLVGARRRLAEMTASRLPPGEETTYWSLELKDAAQSAGARIHNLETCLGTLQHPDTAPLIRERECELFTSHRLALTEATIRIRTLLLVIDADAVGTMTDAIQEIADQLRRADESLRAVVCLYEERPSALDSGEIGASGAGASAERVMTAAYRLLREKVYAADGPVSADRDLWDAFRGQQAEFVGFYEAALSALEAYRDVLRAYSATRERMVPQPGELAQIRRDKHVHLEERAACIDALRQFQEKFSAMLVVLRPVSR